MVRKVKDGERVNGYKVTKLLNVGALAIAYAAESAAGEKVFFKQYKSPSITVEWYKGYVAYQQALKQRIEEGTAARFTYRFVDFFEFKWGHLCYFQVFEFVEEGHDLEQILDKIRENPRSFTWEQRVIYAKVIMAAVGAAPVAASDVFTCGLILHELLTTGHPYQIDEPGDYYTAVMAYGGSRPKLIGTMPSPATNADVEEALHRCLAPEAARRPSALEILRILNGQIKASDDRVVGRLVR